MSPRPDRPILHSAGGVTLVAGGPVTRAELARATARAPVVVAADGGADRALALGADPVAAVGDMDSIGPAARAALAGRLYPIAEQETTDFDKALRSVAARFVLALGVLGGRVDHALAALSTLAARAGQPVVALGGPDVVFAAPAAVDLALRAGDRLSLYPLGPRRGVSTGLDWPIDGLLLSPEGWLGTSNRVATGPVGLRFDAPGTLVVLPRARLDAVLDALSPGWRGAAGR